jgi:CubicO group peptidase (beta-lactamase class C family)
MSDLVPLPRQPAGIPWPKAGWPRGELGAGVDAASIARLFEAAFSPAADPPGTNAVLVVHQGRIVAERYADGMDESTTHISWSMAKSILHAVCGLLLAQGRLSLEGPVGIPAWSDPKDPRREIDLDQLLKMRSGLRFLEDYSDEQQSSVIEMLFGTGQADVAAFAAASPLDHEPGSFFSYSSGTSNIVSSLVSRALRSDLRPDSELEPGKTAARGEIVERFVRQQLFDRVDMKSPTLRFDDAGTWIASSFVFASARDFARFGLLYLRDGLWDGTRVLPPGWVDHGRRMTDSAEAETFSYGAHWWVIPGSLGIFQANGYNGQRITLVPGLDLVVVRLGETPADASPNLNVWMKAVVDAFRGAR